MSLRSFLHSVLLASSLVLASADDADAAGLHQVRVTNGAVYGSVGSPGKPVKLTLDPDLQRAAERLLARAGAPEGAIVASDVRTGRILAWASRGGRDFVSEPYAPSASLFKIVTAASLLEGGHANESTNVCYEGGEHEIRPADLEHGGGTCVEFGEALGKSINMVFARMARKHLDAGDLRRMATSLGFSGDRLLGTAGVTSTFLVSSIRVSDIDMPGVTITSPAAAGVAYIDIPRSVRTGSN